MQIQANSNQKAFLVITRAGDKSLHEKWLNGASRNFDLFVSYFGDQPEKFKHTADYFEAQKGPKWPILYELLERHWTWISQYDAVWLPDDDIDMSPGNIQQMFNLFAGLKIDVAQPALTYNSYVAHRHLLVKATSIARKVNFVEVMAPLFNIKSLSELKITFSQSVSGWGLDVLWPKLIPGAQFGIIDATPMFHTRPLGGELYKKNNLSTEADMQALGRLYPQFDIRLSAPSSKFRIYSEICQAPRLTDGLARIKGIIQNKLNTYKYNKIGPSATASTK